MKTLRNNKFYTILGTFTKPEVNEFCEFLELSFIKKPRLSKVVIQKMRSGRDLDGYLRSKYSARTQWNIYSELTLSIKQFISLKEILLDKNEMHKLKRKQMYRRDLNQQLIQDYKNDIKLKLSNNLSYETMRDVSMSAYLCLFSFFRSVGTKEIDNFYRYYSDFRMLSFILETMTLRIDSEMRKNFYAKQSFLNDEIYGYIDIENILKAVKVFFLNTIRFSGSFIS